MPAVIVVGLQWGDEGKGKLVDILADSAAHVVRAQGGNNAGHTVKRQEGEFAFHLIPSGILAKQATCYIGGGTLIDPKELLQEIGRLQQRGITLSGRLLISPYAYVVFPFHRQLDQLYEAQKGKQAIGTTGRGIGPCVQDRAARIGVRMGEFITPAIFKKRLEALLSVKNAELERIHGIIPIEIGALFNEYTQYGHQLAEYVGDVEGGLSRALRMDENVLFEGAHGSMLDWVFGTAPFVTSSLTTAAGVCAGAGVGPTEIDEVIGVLKAYTTRVGAGPLPTALSEEEKEYFMKCEEAREVGTTTGRKRRLAWLDGPMAKFAIRLSGVDQLAVTKLDVLDHLSEIKICTGYRLNGATLQIPPMLIEDLEKVEPIYETLPGWQQPTTGAQSLKDLPFAARQYLDRIAQLCEVPIGIVSVGPDRAQTLFLQKEWEQ